MGGKKPLHFEPAGAAGEVHFTPLRELSLAMRRGDRFTGKASANIDRVYYDTPKFEFLKKKSAVFSERRGRKETFFFIDGVSVRPITPGGSFHREMFPYLRLSGKKHPARLAVGDGSTLRGGLVTDVTLQNPVTGRRVRGGGFYEFGAEAAVIEKELPFRLRNFRGLLSHGFTDRFKQLEIPFIPDEPGAGFAISREDDLADALGKAISKELYKVRGYRNFVTASLHPEYLHEMRVAMRRIRSYLAVFPDALGRKRSVSMNITASSYGIDLGRMRDYDVFTSRFGELLEEAGAGPDKRFFLGMFAKARNDDNEIADRVIRSKKFPLFLERMENFAQKRALKSPSGRALFLLSAFGALSSLGALTRKRVKKFRKTGAPEDLHRVRITFKRLRYVFELAARFMDGRAGKYRKCLEEIQDSLGSCQDLRVAERLIGEAVEMTEEKEKILVFGSVRQIIRQRLGKEIAKFVKLDREFEKLPLPGPAKGG